MSCGCVVGAFTGSPYELSPPTSCISPKKTRVYSQVFLDSPTAYKCCFGTKSAVLKQSRALSNLGMSLFEKYLLNHALCGMPIVFGAERLPEYGVIFAVFLVIVGQVFHGGDYFVIGEAVRPR